MKKHGHDGARHRKDIDIEKKNLSGTQTKGAAKTQRKSQSKKDLCRGRATESRGTKVERSWSLRISKSDKKIPKGQNTHLRKQKTRLTGCRLRTGSEKKPEKRQGKLIEKTGSSATSQRY
jgi:hypothetical protein